MPRGSTERRHINKNFELIGVFVSAAAFLAYIRASTAQEGMTYYDTTLNQLRTHDGVSWSNAGSDSQSAGSLDDAANQGTKITIDGAMTTGIEIEATDAIISSGGALLLLDNDDTGSDIHCLELTDAGTAASIQITSAQASDDIQGTTDTWAITSAGAATLTGVALGTNDKLLLGDSSDNELYFDGTDLHLVPVATDEVFKIGQADGTNNYDVFLYSATNGRYIQWDNTARKLNFIGSHILLNDDSTLLIGTGSDITMEWDNSASVLLITGSGKTIDFGEDGEGLDINWHTETASARVYFDETNSDVDFDAVTLSMNDGDAINFGDENDMVLSWDTTGTDHLHFAPAAGDAPVIFGNGTTDPIVKMFAGSTQKYWQVTPSTEIITIAQLESRYHDSSPIVMGTSQDVTLQWNGASDKFDITVNNTSGYVHFLDDVVIGTASSDEENLTVNGNVTITGTLTHTGAFNPSSLALDDTETITFGTGTDYTIATAGSTAALIISATNANDSITIGDGSVDTDFRIDNASGSSNDFLFDASGDSTNGELLLGVDGKGFDVSFFGESPNALILWDQSVDKLLVEQADIAFGDGDKIIFGDTLGTGDISVEATASVLSWLPEAGGCEIYYGANTNGIDCTWFAVSSGDYMKWDESGNSNLGALIFEDSAIQFVGSTSTYTLAIASDTLLITATDAAGSILTLGETGGSNGMDVIWTSITSGDDLILDAASKTVTLSDLTLVLTDDTVAYSLAHSTNALTLTATDNANAQLTIGSSAGTNSIDLLLQSATAASKVTWDGQTNAIAILNGTVDYTIAHSTNTLLITATDSASAKIAIGDVSTTNSVDLDLISAVASNTVTWNGGTNVISINNGTVDYSFDHSTNSLLFDATDHSGAKLVLGTSGTNGLDVTLQGATAGDQINWDAANGTLAFTDATNTYTATIGTSLAITASDLSTSKITIGDAATTNSIDLELISATASNTVSWNGGTNAIAIANGTTTYTIDHATNSLAFTATDVGSSMITIGTTGGTNSCDLQLIGASASETITYDGANNSLAFADGTITYTLDHDGSNYFTLTGTDAAAARVVIGATGGSNGVDFQLNTITSGEDVIFDAAGKTLTLDNVDIILGDSDSIGFGDSAAESTIISDGSNTEWIIASGAVQIGDGGGTNYTAIASTGAITLSGTAKVQRTIPLDHMSLALAGTSDNSTVTGTGSTNLDADGETIYGSFRMPADWDAASDITLIFAVQNEIAEDDGDDISIVMDLWGIADGEANPGTGQAPTAALNLTGGDQNINAVNHVEVTIDYNDAGNPIAADDIVCFNGAIELGGGTECTGPLHIIGCWVEYTASSLDQV